MTLQEQQQPIKAQHTLQFLAHSADDKISLELGSAQIMLYTLLAEVRLNTSANVAYLIIRIHYQFLKFL